ncbi:MAG: PHP domain-containing protein [Alphaproteobacteria bacterium]|nr:PHP domain-containing protein [Alphaproteobacteria bacterium]
MIVADFHVHSTFSVDGMSTMEQHCIMAMQKGIKKICFTEHVDYNIAEYNVGKVKDNRRTIAEFAAIILIILACVKYLKSK